MIPTSKEEAEAAWHLLREHGITYDTSQITERDAVDAVRAVLDAHNASVEFRQTLRKLAGKP